MGSGIPLPSLNLVLCNGCGRCVAVCPEQALVLSDNPPRPQLHPQVECEYCGLCEELCPTSAITLSYEIVFGQTD